MVNPSESTEQASSEDAIDLRELWATVWRDRWWVIIITGVFTLGGITYSLLAQEWWRVELTATPVQKSGMSSTLARLGGLASLAGVDVGRTDTTEPVAVLKSRAFAREFIEDLDLMPILLEGVTSPDDEPLDIRDAVKVFDEDVRTVDEDRKAGLVTLGVRWKDPELAAQWANEMLKRVNDTMRRQALEEAERNVAFLQKEIALTGIVSLQQSMGRVLEGEMQKLMLARGNEEFVFKVIDRAVPPKRRESPKRTLITLMAMLIGGCIGLATVFGRQAWRSGTARAR